MEEFIFTPIVLVVGLAVHAALIRRHTGPEQTLLTAGFVLHVAASFGQVFVTRYYYGFGDMLSYFEFAVPGAQALRSDPVTFFPALFEAFFRTGDISAPLEFTPGGGSTLSMSALAMLVDFFCGDSLYACVLVFGIGSYLSKVMLYWALRKDFPLPVHRYVLMGVLLLPTAAFWSSGMLKEPAVMLGLGPMVLGLRWLADGHRRVLALIMIAAAGTLIAMIKAYVLMVLSIAAGVFYLGMRLKGRGPLVLKPFAVITAAALGLGGFVLGNRFFIKADNESTAAAMATQRQRGYAVEGGSNYNLDGPGGLEGDVQDRSIAREALLAPFALVTALFRPFIFEARNAIQLANAIECTVLLVLLVQIVRKKRWAGVIREIRDSPTLMFASIFTLALAVGTGLASTNLGTLSRYRTPMMPFFFMILLVLRYGDEAVKRAAALKKGGESQSPAPAAPTAAVAALARRPAAGARFR